MLKKLRGVVIVIGFLLSAFLVSAQSEADYSDYLQTKIGGVREYRVPNGRVDILTDTHAYEVEWASKWKNSIGQSLWYGLQTNTIPGIILILKSEADYKYVVMLNSALQYAGLEHAIKVLVYPLDFEK